MITEALKTTYTEATLVSKMYKDIHGWAILSFVLGAASLVFFTQLDPTWGIVLIITAALSLKTRIPQMFRLYAVLMGWAAVSNVMDRFGTGDWGWCTLGAMQLLWTVAIVRQYRKYRQLPLADLYKSGNWPEKLGPPQEETVILGRFSNASLHFTVFMLILFSTCLGLVILGYALAAQGGVPPEPEINQPEVDNIFSYIFNGALSLTVFGLALGTAALVPENPKRRMALAGVIISSVILALYFACFVIILLVTC